MVLCSRRLPLRFRFTIISSREQWRICRFLQEHWPIPAGKIP
jgi:hypothetical protein